MFSITNGSAPLVKQNLINVVATSHPSKVETRVRFPVSDIFKFKEFKKLKVKS